MSEHLSLTCPHCGRQALLARNEIESVPTWYYCHHTMKKVAVVCREDGTYVTAALTEGRNPRKGEKVLVRHAYTMLHGEVSEWHTIEAVGYGGQRPRRADGSLISPDCIIGVIG
jgi:hypothetical protein